MVHPVITSTGHTYERYAIEERIGHALRAGQHPVDHENVPIHPLRATDDRPLVPTDYTTPNHAIKAVGWLLV
jgi:hypothetical protein